MGSYQTSSRFGTQADRLLIDTLKWLKKSSSNILGLVYYIFEYILFILKYNKAKLGKALEYLDILFEYIKKVLKYGSWVLPYSFHCSYYTMCVVQ